MNWALGIVATAKHVIYSLPKWPPVLCAAPKGRGFSNERQTGCDRATDRARWSAMETRVNWIWTVGVVVGVLCWSGLVCMGAITVRLWSEWQHVIVVDDKWQAGSCGKDLTPRWHGNACLHSACEVRPKQLSEVRFQSMHRNADNLPLQLDRNTCIL